jgi:hypothetical protein
VRESSSGPADSGACLFEQPQLQHVRRVEPVDAQDRAGRSRSRAGRHEADELGSHDVDTARMGLRLDPLDDVMQGRCLPILDVHAHLHTPRTRKRQTKSSHTRKPAAGLTKDRRD